MTTIDVLSPAGKKSGTVDLPDAVFGVQTNIPLIHQVVVAQLAAARQGTHSTKTRGEVRGGGRKPYRQKGTGRARQGSTRAPQFAGGGVVHGPKPRDYSQRTPKKMKAAALRGALSDRARHGRIHVLTGVVEGQNPSTKDAQKVLGAISDRKNLLVVLERADQAAIRSIRNLENVHVLWADQLNTYDVLCADDVVFTQGSLETFLAGPSKTLASADTAKAPVATEEVESVAPATLVDVPSDGVVAEQAADTAAPAKTAKDGGFGPDSKAPLKSGNAPKGFEVKGNQDSMKFHVPGSRWYDATEAEVWFRTADAAEAAGFAPAGGAEAQQVDEEETT